MHSLPSASDRQLWLHRQVLHPGNEFLHFLIDVA
jgi:hypothetical protein